MKKLASALKRLNGEKTHFPYDLSSPKIESMCFFFAYRRWLRLILHSTCAPWHFRPAIWLASTDTNCSYFIGVTLLRVECQSALHIISLGSQLTAAVVVMALTSGYVQHKVGNYVVVGGRPLKLSWWILHDARTRDSNWLWVVFGSGDASYGQWMASTNLFNGSQLLTITCHESNQP